MFDINSLSKLKDAIPEDVKEKVSEAVKQQFSDKVADVKNSATTKLGLTSPVSGQTPEAAAVDPAAIAQDQADKTPNLKVDESEQSELEEDKTDAA
jgi:hypothetical protein